MSTEQVKMMSAMDIFALHQETFEEAKKKSNDESGNRAAYLRFSQDGTYTVRMKAEGFAGHRHAYPNHTRTYNA